MSISTRRLALEKSLAWTDAAVKLLVQRKGMIDDALSEIEILLSDNHRKHLNFAREQVAFEIQGEIDELIQLKKQNEQEIRESAPEG